MKRRLLILIMVALSACFSLVGCGSDEDFLDRDSAVKVVFNLEGGKYQNSPAPIVYYYGFKKGTENLIKNPAAEDTKDEKADKFNNSEITREDHYLDGWYRTKTEVADGRFDYSDKWDFKTDRVTDDGVELYAKWIKNIHYTYGVYYINEDGEEKSLGSYEVDAGDKFVDYLELAEKRPGRYTPKRYRDEDGNDWDFDFTHPGGDNNTEIKIYVDYDRGQFVEVRTAAELVANVNQDIKLMNDIDMSDLLTEEQKANGEIMTFSGFTDYDKIFFGNGFTIKNFKLEYKQGRYDLMDDDDIGRFVLGISLFGGMVGAEGAEVKDVKFENVTIDVDASSDWVRSIIVAPICVKAAGSSFTNVSFSGTYTFTRMPSGVKAENFKVITDRAYYFKDGDSTFENVIVTIDNQIENQIA